MTKRIWRKPIKSDIYRKCRARNEFEPQPFSVEWSLEHKCWAKYGRPHLLILVQEVLSEKNEKI